MKPYYQHAGITIYHGDCREILPTLPSVDAVITDPPYGVGMEAFDDDFASVAALNLANGLILAAFMSPRRLNQLIASLPSWTFERCLWMHKQADIAFPWRGWCMNSEAIVIFSRDGSMWPPPQNYRSDLYQVGPWERAGHPNGKPLEVVTDLVNRLSVESTVDPFCGSGTTLRAAKNLGRRAIGIEIEEKYCEIAAKRLSQEVLVFE